MGFSTVVIALSVDIVCGSAGPFYITYEQVNNFGLESLKIALGCVETFFGIFIGMISDTLFGRAPVTAAGQALGNPPAPKVAG